MRNKFKYILVIVVSLLMLGGCEKKEETLEYTIDSKVNYFITMPNNKQDWFSLSFYRIYNGEKDYSNILEENDTFTVGQDVILLGENVDALNGAIVKVNQNNFIENESYCDNLAYLYGYRYGQLVEDDAVMEKIKDKVEESVAKYANNAKTLGMCISYWGKVSENVRIEQLQIPSLDITFDFENFEIDTIDVPEGIRINEEIAIEHNLAGGVFAGATVGGTGTKFIDGKAMTGIKSIIVSPANQYCYMAEEDMERSYKEGDEIQLEYDYYFNENIIDWEQSDTLVASMITKIVTEDGIEIWEFEHQASIVEPSFLLKTLIFEELANTEIE